MAQRIKSFFQLSGPGMIVAEQQANEMRAASERARLNFARQQASQDRAAKIREGEASRQYGLDMALMDIFSKKEAAALRAGNEKEAADARASPRR